MSIGADAFPDWVIWAGACVAMAGWQIEYAMDRSASLAERLAAAIAVPGFLYFALRAWWLP